MEGVRAVGAYQEGLPSIYGSHVHLWARLSQLCISPCPAGSSGTAVMLASSALDAVFLLGAPERCPVREGVSWVHGQPWEQGLGASPTLPASPQETLMSLFASHSCPTRTEGLGLSCLPFPPGCPMGDKPLPGNKLCITKCTIGLPVPKSIAAVVESLETEAPPTPSLPFLKAPTQSGDFAQTAASLASTASSQGEPLPSPAPSHFASCCLSPLPPNTLTLLSPA